MEESDNERPRRREPVALDLDHVEREEAAEVFSTATARRRARRGSVDPVRIAVTVATRAAMASTRRWQR